jgi:hypothetical protein
MLLADKESGTKPQESVATRESHALIAAKSAISAVKETRSKAMSSTTYEHFVDTNKMYAIQEQFRHVTKMVTKRHRFAVIGNMVRNAGELPQPFWLGAARGGGSCGAARCAART